MSTPMMPPLGTPSVAGPAPAAMPAPQGPWNPTLERPLTEDELKKWQARIERGIANDKLYHPQWERGTARYAKALTPAPGVGDDISALLDYRHTEGSKAGLFFRTPDVNLLPVDPQDQAVPYQVILPLREKVLNYELGPDRANAKRALHKTLIDTITASGWMITKIGFESVRLPAGPDPMTGLPPMNPDGTPMEVPIWSRRFWSAVSSKKLIVPADFHDTDFDQAPWLAIRGCMPIPSARRMKWKLRPDFEGTRVSDNETRYDDGSTNEDASDPQVEYTEIWYKASLFDEAVFNPDLYRCLILVKGEDVHAWHQDSPYQTLTPEGALTDDSMIGNPIHVDAIRDVLDSAHVPSDLAIIEKESIELDRFRTTLVRNRRSRRPITLVNDRLGQPIIDKMTENAGPVPVPGEYLEDGSNGSRALAVSQAATEPRDNYTAQQIVEHDVELAVGRSANQSGQYTGKKVSATETKVVQANSKARASVDIDRVREYFMRGARKFDAVLQRTMTPQELTKILGQQGAALWEQWRALPGTYAYKIQPDSGRFVDAEEYRVQKVNEYNLFRKDPMVNAQELLTQVFTALGYDAGKLVLPQQPEKPEPAKVSMSLSLDKAPPPAMTLALTILEQQGLVLTPELKALMMAQATLNEAMAALEQTQQAEHGGPAQKTERIDKRQESRTGGTEGIGRSGIAA